MASLESFSDEILEQIFLQLPRDSMKMLTLVSKRFNEVISSSIKLMDDFDVYWSKKKNLDMRPLLQSTRKYQKLQILGVSGLKPNLHQFIANHCTTLRNLYFYDCSFAASDVLSILELVSANIEDFNMCEVNLEADVDDLPVSPMALPKLKQIDLMYEYCSGFTPLIKAFEGSQVNIFRYYDYNQDVHDVVSGDLFKSFLISQKKLRQLSLFIDVSNLLFETPDFASSVEFQAEEIIVWMSGPTDNGDAYENLSLFLETQRDSLQSLTLQNCILERPIMDTILSFESLKNLRLEDNNFDWEDGDLHVISRSVEKMLISFNIRSNDQALCDVIKRCPRLKELKFDDINVTFALSMVMAHKLKCLSEIDFHNCKFELISYPHVKKMSFSGCDVKDVVRLILVNRHLKEIAVPFHFSQEESFLANMIEAGIEAIVYDQQLKK